MSYPGPPVEFTKDKPLRLTVGPNDSGICAISESQPDLVVNGTVELHLAFVQEKQIERVTLTFTSAVSTRIRHGQHTYTDTMSPCRDKKIALWKIGTAFPPPGEHVLRYPFTFPLPAGCPPSLWEDGPHLATVTYKLELRGERNVTFGFDFRIERIIHVIPPTFSIGRLHSTSGQNLVRVGKVDIGRSMFKHEKGRVELQLNIPGQNNYPFPINTEFPFTVTVTTYSIPVDMATDPQTDKDARCPSIDIASLHLLLRLGLKRYTTLRVREIVSRERTMSTLRILPNFQRRDMLDVDIGPKEWVEYIGNDETLRGKGHWKQQFVFKSFLALTSEIATPTFRHTLIDVSYALRLECIIPSQRRFTPDYRITVKFPMLISYEINSASSPAGARANQLLTDSDVGRVYSA